MRWIWVLIVGCIGAAISCYTPDDYKYHIGVVAGMIIAIIIGFN